MNCALAAAAGVLSPMELASRLSRAAASSSPRLLVTLLADNDFYSQRAHLLARGLPVSSAALSSLPPHLPCPLGPDGRPDVHKTGLGSSAALVTSLVAATLATLGVIGDLEARADSVSASSSSSGATAGIGSFSGVQAAASARQRPVLGPEAARALVHATAQVAHGLAQVRGGIEASSGRR
jgi:hypothetical protein